jgi:hypothetical protein
MPTSLQLPARAIREPFQRQRVRSALAVGFFAWGWVRGFCGVQLPEDLAHYGGPHGGVAGGEVEAADEAADAVVGVGDGAAIEEAAGAEGFGEDGGEAFDFGGCGGLGFF